jgi:hypothetical protein
MTLPSVEAQILWPPPEIDKIDRFNLTPAKDQHPKDHEDLENAVNAILAILGSTPHGIDGNLSARLQVVDVVIEQLKGNFEGLTLTLEDTVRQVVLESGTQGHYVHQQTMTADVWYVPHNLGYDPVVEVIRDDGVRILGFDIEYALDKMSFIASFSQAIAGRVLLAN